MNQNTTTTSRVTVLSDLAGRYDAPDDRSGGLDALVTAAKAARDAYDELDEQTYQAWRSCERSGRTDNRQTAAVYDLLRASRDVAYETWQQLERLGLPLLQAWQRDTLGYDEEEITPA